MSPKGEQKMLLDYIRIFLMSSVVAIVYTVVVFFAVLGIQNALSFFSGDGWFGWPW